MASFVSPMLRAPQQHFVLRNARGDIVAEHLEPAFDSQRRRRGLLGRTCLEPRSALILAPCSAIHTFFMRMPIDVMFVSRDGKVLKTCSALPAWRMALALGAFAVIELPSGTIARTGTRRGDRLLLATE